MVAGRGTAVPARVYWTQPKTAIFTFFLKFNYMKKTILVLPANPSQTARLRLGQEVREIEEALRGSKYRDNFLLKSCSGVRPKDIRRALLQYQPHIVHFCGHGVGKQGLLFEDETGKGKLVRGEALAGLFGLFSSQIECVLLNACYSEFQTEAIVQHIDYVIGMNNSIGDNAAITFATGFYEALGFYEPQLGGSSPIEFAFDMGCSSIQLEGFLQHKTPIMKKKREIILEESESIRAYLAAQVFESKAIPFGQVVLDKEEEESIRAFKAARICEDKFIPLTQAVTKIQEEH
ncbi:hypothetical protein NIES2100_62500 [Calothrix sp. NIES-2100]|nr:hypothetical protein NIES2100_62500 [Calothrix sp. NIES-2100]